MIKLSVNLNKVAWLRNARNSNIPNVVEAAIIALDAGASGITVHPRPDERHIKPQDIRDLAALVAEYNQEGKKIELNIEGYPSDDFMELVLEIKPNQCTLVPDAPEQLVTDHAWNLRENFDLVATITDTLQAAKIRVAVLLDPDSAQVELAKEAGADRIELYTAPYALAYEQNTHEKIIQQYIQAAETAKSLVIGINAGRDFNLMNLPYFAANMPNLLEVAVGHSLIADSLILGLETAVKSYLSCLQFGQYEPK